jgi:hypothetical protein
LRFGDLRKQRRWGKPFERRPEHRPGVEVPAARTVQSGEDERGAQFEAASALALGDRDRG